jgi:hypothetical protein
LPLLALAACSGEPEPTPTATPSATPDKPKMLVPADLGELVLGARIEGPQGPEVESTVAADGAELAEIVSYVACPEGVTLCESTATLPETVYTYVHRVTPADGVENATLFRTTRAATGFANGVGYDRAEAAEALGEAGRIDVSSDNGALVWRVVGGDGWKAGETITFYWQSTLAPEGPREAYQFEAEGTSAQGSGPFPPRETPVEGTPPG